MRIGILGGGGWGLAIGKLLNENGHLVNIWEYDITFVNLLKQNHANEFLLPNVILPSDILFTNDLKELFKFNPDILITAVPAQYLRQVLQQCKDYWDYIQPIAIVNLAKGIEEHTLMRMSEVLLDEIPERLHPFITGLSGPSLADEVANKVPTTVVIAGKYLPLLNQLQVVFSNSYFRTYSSEDLIGVEIGGAVKNVIAIAAGIIDGLGYGDNTKGALLTRGMVEIQRLGIACGARAETFWGLSGLGDLVTTAFSKHSRNRFVGNEIGKGRNLSDILSTMKSVAEGVASTRSVFALATKLKVDMPIVSEIHLILFSNKNPRLAIQELMNRELKPEVS